MEAGKLSSCRIGSARHPLCGPPSGGRRGSAATKLAYAVRSSYTPTSFHLYDGCLQALSPQLSLLSGLGTFSNLVALLPVRAAEEASSSSSSVEAASSSVPGPPTSFHVSDGPLQAVSPQLTLLPGLGAIPNLVALLPVRAAEEASSSSSSVEAASSSVPENVGASLESAGAAASQTLQSSGESVGGDAAGLAASEAIQSSITPKTAGAAAAAGESDMIINILGTLAFVALSLLTIAVFYLFITDFLEKRKTNEEMKRLNEEEAAARKKRKSPLTTASKGGPKGFGSKPQVDDE